MEKNRVEEKRTNQNTKLSPEQLAYSQEYDKTHNTGNVEDFGVDPQKWATKELGQYTPSGGEEVAKK